MNNAPSVTPPPTGRTILTNTAWWYLSISILVLIMKAVGYYWTKSEAILSDALESIVNVLTAMVSILVMRGVTAPADEDHPYGHGKMEYFSAAFEGGMIVITALVIAVEAFQALIHQAAPHELEKGMQIIAVTALLNLFLGFYLKSIGKKMNSDAFRASGTHIMADVWTTLGIIAGLLLVQWTGWVWLDPGLALFVAVMLSVSGYKIMRKAVGVLMDEMDPAVLQQLAKAMAKNRKPGLIDVHNTRMIRAGNFHHIDAHLVVPNFWDAVKVNAESQEYEKKVVSDYPFDAEFAFHVDPCLQKYCSHCDLLSCPIRLHPFDRLKEISAATLVEGA